MRQWNKVRRWRRRPPDRDAHERLNRPAHEVARHYLTLLLERECLTEEEVTWIEKIAWLLVRYDPRLYTHCCAVAVIAFDLARQAGDTEEECTFAFVAGFLHDWGKVRIPRWILYGPNWAWRLFRKFFRWVVHWHVWAGYFLLKQEQDLRKEKNRFSEPCAVVALFHHFEQRDAYPTQYELEHYGVEYSIDCFHSKLLGYVEVADNVEASNRLESGARYENPPTPEQRRQTLIKRNPHLATLIERAFDGIVH